MFTRAALLILLLLSFSHSSFALSGFIKEGGGYGVKPIRELIKESEEGRHNGVNLNNWLNHRSEQEDLQEIIIRYQNALRIRTQIMHQYQSINDEDLRILRKKVLFIQGLLIININNINNIFLTNQVSIDQEKLKNISSESLRILGIQIEDGYCVIDLLHSHMIETIQTDINEGLELRL